jgi:hypothetical protein
METGMTFANPLTDYALLASYQRYEEAQRDVDTLADQDFPVTDVEIVGSDLRLVEVVTGRLTTSRAALAGAGTGLWVGLLIGVIISLGTPYLVGPMLWGLFWGAVFGAILGALGHLAWRGTRDFSSTRQLTAGRYDVLIPQGLLTQAQRVLNVFPEASRHDAGPNMA